MVRGEGDDVDGAPRVRRGVFGAAAPAGAAERPEGGAEGGAGDGGADGGDGGDAPPTAWSLALDAAAIGLVLGCFEAAVPSLAFLLHATPPDTRAARGADGAARAADASRSFGGADGPPN